MEKNHKLTLYVSYYLSRFNNEALINLNYKTWSNAFEDISKKLNVKRLSVRNWRDEFDPIFQHRNRDLGCGYDFRIESNNLEAYIEVKGLADISGGILFKDKEWQVASDKGEDFFFCIVKKVKENPEINFIQNPASKIKPKKNISTTIQINWIVTENDLNNLNA